MPYTKEMRAWRKQYAGCHNRILQSFIAGRHDCDYRYHSIHADDRNKKQQPRTAKRNPNELQPADHSSSWIYSIYPSSTVGVVGFQGCSCCDNIRSDSSPPHTHPAEENMVPSAHFLCGGNGENPAFRLFANVFSSALNQNMSLMQNYDMIADRFNILHNVR